MPSKRELDALEHEQLKRKLTLEKEFTPKMRTLVNKMATDLATTYAASGVILNAKNFAKAFEKELTDHYHAVTKEFTAFINVRVVSDNDYVAMAFDNYAKKTGKSLKDVLAMVTEKQNHHLDKAIKTNVANSVEAITKTNSREFLKAVDRATTTVIDSGLPVNHSTVGQAVEQTFKDSNGYRAELIAQVETQKAAEAGKKAAADGANDVITSGNSGNEPVFLKEWVTMGDEKVRPAHVAANGQRRQVDEPYIVMGEELMFPSDETLGASPENTINCRCSSQYVENPNFDNG